MPTPDLQAALAVADWGDEIWVAAGTYKPTTGTDRVKSFVMVAGVGMYGGFAGTETVREQRDWQVHVTILSGDIGTVGNTSDNSNHVIAGGYNAVLDGFNVTGGNGNSGGGMINESVSPIINNCTFSSNSAGSGGNAGGGIYNSDGSPTISNCTFSGNSSGAAGGVISNSGSSAFANHQQLHVQQQLGCRKRGRNS